MPNGFVSNRIYERVHNRIHEPVSPAAIVQVSATGWITAAPTFPSVSVRGGSGFGPDGFVWENGYCSGGVYVTSTNGDGSGPACGGPVPRRTIVAMNGQSHIYRGGFGQVGCPTPDGSCVSYSGGETVTIEPIAAELTLSASKPVIAPGDSVVFSYAITPDSIGGYLTPVESGSLYGSWSFVTDSGVTLGIPSCPGSGGKPCMHLTQSGTMTLDLYVNGLHKVRTKHITVIPCPTGDSIADQAVVRRALLDALIASNPDSAPGSGFRHEEGGNIWILSDGTFTTTRFADPSPTECHIQMDQQPVPPATGATRVALYHTHPASTGDDVYGCDPDPNTGHRYAQYPGDGYKPPPAAPNTNGGGSRADWRVAAQQLPMYIINKEGYMYRLVTDNQPNPPASNRDKWNTHLTNGCWDRVP